MELRWQRMTKEQKIKVPRLISTHPTVRMIIDGLGSYKLTIPKDDDRIFQIQKW